MAETAKKEEVKEVEVNPFKGLDFVSLATKANKENEKLSDREAMKLIRVTVTCNDLNKQSYHGDIISVRNSTLGEVKKFVPFGVVTHIPMIMYNFMKERQTVRYYKEKTDHGNETRTKLINYYNIEIHSPITTAELEAIKQKQLAEQTNPIK